LIVYSNLALYNYISTVFEIYNCFGSHQYAKVVVFSKVPLPNYRSDLDDKRPQREVFSRILTFIAYWFNVVYFMFGEKG
jgi:hypothetical protein